MKSLFIVLLCMMVGHITKVQASSNVIYRDYIHFEKEVYKKLMKSGDVSTFNSMRNLQQQGCKVKENTIVPLTTQAKARSKKMDGTEIASERSKSTLVICRYTSNPFKLREKIVVWATAVVLSSDGICLTNYHVLQPFISKSAKLAANDSLFFAATQDKKLYSIEKILSYNKEADMAIFKIDTKGDKLPAVPLGNDLPEGAQVHTLTHPYEHIFSYSRGVVARNLCTDLNNPFTNRTEITAPYAKGSSGGGIYDDCGNLIGMVSTTQSIYYNEQLQQNLQMVVKTIIPVSSIKKLIK